jgi:hypothetical protein
VVTTIANPTISALFDKMQAQKALMLLSTVGEAVTQIAMLVPGQGYLGMLVWNTLHSLAGGHHSPTFDASTMMVCPDRYGEIRLLGSAAFGLAAFGGGALMSLVNPSLTFVAAFGAASAIQLLSLPLIGRLNFSMLHVNTKKQPADASAGTGKAVGGKAAKKEEDNSPKLSELLKACTSPKMLFVIVITFLCGWQSSLIDVFFNVHLSNIGAENVFFGVLSLCLSRACLGKMIVLMYKWLKKAGFCRSAGCPDGHCAAADVHGGAAGVQNVGQDPQSPRYAYLHYRTD